MINRPPGLLSTSMGTLHVTLCAYGASDKWELGPIVLTHPYIVEGRFSCEDFI